MKFGIGQPVPRTEDPRFLKGVGRYVGDLQPPNLAHGFVLRSPHAHALIRSIDVAKAKKAPGVLAVLTGFDARADGLGLLPCTAPPIAFGGPPKAFMALHPILSHDRVRHVGDPVAFVVAETLNEARDAAELIEVDYSIQPACVSTGDATKGRRAAGLGWRAEQHLVRHGARRQGRDRRCLCQCRAHRVAQDRQQPAVRQLDGGPGRDGGYDPTGGKTTLHTSTQQPHKVRAGLAGAVFREPEMKFRVVSPDVGGGFGMKGGVFPEDALVAWAARKVLRPVKWVSERSEGIMSDTHGRDSVSEASLALDQERQIPRAAGLHQLRAGRLSRRQRRRAGRHGLDGLHQCLRHRRRRTFRCARSIPTPPRSARIAAPASRKRST